MRRNCPVGPVVITEGLIWMLGLGYVRKWHKAMAVFPSRSEGSPFESTPSFAEELTAAQI